MSVGQKARWAAARLHPAGSQRSVLHRPSCLLANHLIQLPHGIHGGAPAQRDAMALEEREGLLPARLQGLLRIVAAAAGLLA
jgi:hypothetical protein